MPKIGLYLATGAAVLAPSFVNLMLKSEQVKPLADDEIFHIFEAILS